MIKKHFKIKEVIKASDHLILIFFCYVLFEQVLLWWINFKADLTCGTLIAKLNEWQEKGFVTEGVWGKMKDLLEFEIPVISTSDKSSDRKGIDDYVH